MKQRNRKPTDFIVGLGMMVSLLVGVTSTTATEAVVSKSAGSEERTGEVIEDAKGTMRQVDNFGFAIVPDADPGSRYAPNDEVPESFRVEGLRVLFSGAVSDPGEGRGGRRWGTPITLTRLERLPEADSDETPESDPPR